MTPQDRRTGQRRQPDRDRRVIDDRRLPEDPSEAVLALAQQREALMSDWNRWRGETDQTMRGMTEGIARLEETLERRMDKQDTQLEEIRRQTTATNGKVIRHTSEITTLQGRIVAADEAEARQTALIEHEEGERTNRRWNLAGIVTASGASFILAAIAHYVLHLA